MSLRLPDVTLVMLETRRHAVARLVALDAMRKVEFGDVVILSDCRWDVSGARFVRIEDAPDKLGWERQLWYDVPRHVHTSHMLFVEWDAGVWDEALWEPGFLAYDYVGAPWWWIPHSQVGNGGFSLRSKRLMDHMAANAYWLPCREPGDVFLCRIYRAFLDMAGFRFAPVEEAERFSLEMSNRPGRRFGFHGKFNWPRVLGEAEATTRMEMS